MTKLDKLILEANLHFSPMVYAPPSRRLPDTKPSKPTPRGFRRHNGRPA